jgi:hypothetical protein
MDKKPKKKPAQPIDKYLKIYLDEHKGHIGMRFNLKEFHADKKYKPEIDKDKN